MHWYILTNTTNYKKVGTAVPQAEVVLTDKPFSYCYGSYLRSPAPHNLFVPKLKLRYRARLTDIVSAAFINFPTHSIIHEKFLACLENFHSPLRQAFPTFVIDKKGVEHPYNLFMQNSPQFHAVDYSRSIFSRIAEIKNGYQYVYEDFQATSFEDVLTKKGVRSRAIFMKEDTDFDFFILPAFPFIWLVNEKVANALREAGITGICYIPFQQGDDFVNDDLVGKAIRACGS